jgi:hypothetical protein
MGLCLEEREIGRIKHRVSLISFLRIGQQASAALRICLAPDRRSLKLASRSFDRFVATPSQRQAIDVGKAKVSKTSLL